MLLHYLAYLRCGGVVNNQIKKGLLLSLWVKKIKISEYFTFFVFQQCVGKARNVHETTTLLLVTLPNILWFKKKFSLAH